MKHLAATVLLAAAWMALATPVLAQRGTPGWIGISYEIRSERSRQGAETSVVVTDVRRGSPAHDAGLREGDRLVRINDIRTAREFRDLPQRLRLRAGDRVRIRVERGSRDLDFRLRAGERPRDVVADASLRRTIRTDSVVEAMSRAMDSLRVRLVEVSQRAGPGRPRTPQPDADVTIVSTRTADAVRAPFEFFVFRGEAHDSLRQEMEKLNRSLADVRDLELRRVQELRRASSAPSGVIYDAEDEQLSRLRASLEDLNRRSADLRAAMAEAARATAGLDYQVPVPAAAGRPAEAEPRPFRPLTPYLLGSNRVAGAHVVDLRPELAAYFAVEGGVLIVDVAPGTPAATAGLVPGDVITRLDQVSVRTVEDLRFGVSRAEGTLPITLVRRGESLEVLLRR